MEDNPLLGTSGKEAVPFEYQVEEQQIARKRALAQAMLARGQAPMPETEKFGLHQSKVGWTNHLNTALNSYLGAKGMGDATAAQTGLAQRMGAERSGDMSKFQSLAGTDPKAAIAQALASKWGGVQAQGMDLQKDQRGMRNEIGKMLGTADPVSGAQFIQANDPHAQINPIQTPQPIFATDPSGNAYAQTQDLKGTKPTVTYAPKPMSVTQTNGSKTDVELDKVLIADLSKERPEVAAIPSQISTILRANELINKGAVTGGGASAFQALRKFGQAFGVSVPETGMTEELRMKLGENILANARKLAPVTKNDITMLEQFLGSIDTDPSAMREVNAMMLAKSLLTVDLHNNRVETIKQTTSGNPTKYDPMRVEMGDVDTKDPALLGRAYQLMKDSGHDMSRYKFDGKPVSEIDLNFGFHKPAAGGNGPAEYKIDPAGRIKRVPTQ